MSTNKPSSTNSILGNPKKVVNKIPTHCVVCNKPIPIARLEALQSLNTPLTKYTHTQCSTTTKIKGIYLGEVGTSEIKLCDKVYNDSVRSVFRRAEVDTDEGDEDTGKDTDK